MKTKYTEEYKLKKMTEGCFQGCQSLMLYYQVEATRREWSCWASLLFS